MPRHGCTRDLQHAACHSKRLEGAAKVKLHDSRAVDSRLTCRHPSRVNTGAHSSASFCKVPSVSRDCSLSFEFRVGCRILGLLASRRPFLAANHACERCALAVNLTCKRGLMRYAQTEHAAYLREGQFGGCRRLSTKHQHRNSALYAKHRPSQMPSQHCRGGSQPCKRSLPLQISSSACALCMMATSS